MKWFKTYSSNTLAASGNQMVFVAEAEQEYKGRVYFKIFAGGTYQYSLLFSNVIDSTFFEGEQSRCNKVCDEWDLLSLKIGICDYVDEYTATEPQAVKVLTFNGERSKHVMPGEFFATDVFEFCAEKDKYLCVEIAYRGTLVPTHEESILPAFVYRNGEWIPSRDFPFPGMIGCDRPVQKRIGFWGDSITQGIGTPNNAYSHWSALVGEALGEEYSYWNFGLGFAKAQDAASDGAWMFKAKQMDWVVLCLGTNDIGRGRTETEIKRDLLEVVNRLKRHGVKVLIQTLPPYSFEGQDLEKWIHVNQYIRKELAKKADGFFDIAPLLTDGPELKGKAKYCGHPNEDGCRVWAKELLPVLKKILTD